MANKNIAKDLDDVERAFKEIHRFLIQKISTTGVLDVATVNEAISMLPYLEFLDEPEPEQKTSKRKTRRRRKQCLKSTVSRAARTNPSTASSD